MCAREGVFSQKLQLHENLGALVSSEVQKATRSLEKKLDDVLAKLSEQKSVEKQLGNTK